MARKPLSQLLFRQICPFSKTRNQLIDMKAVPPALVEQMLLL
jgi:hypothetical protein